MNCGSSFPWICLPYVCSHYLCLCLEVDQKAKSGMILMVTASKKPGLLVIHPQGIEFGQQPPELRRGSQAPERDTALMGTAIALQLSRERG